MKYLYYPGCSLEGTAKEYDRSTRAVLAALGAELVELSDWTCCGASAALAVSELLALALPARNLALAEAQGEGLDLLVPCSACYLNLKKAEVAALTPEKLHRVNQVLEADGLRFKGRVRVRHLLDVLTRDFNAARIKELTQKPLDGLTAAPYYGCQCLRPFAEFDDPERPVSMEPLIRALGGSVWDWDMGSRCCGASHMTVNPEAGAALVGAILEAAAGAGAVITVCPMCQINLEAHQHKISRARGRDLSVSVLYLPQLLGLAWGLPDEQIALGLNLALTPAVKNRTV